MVVPAPRQQDGEVVLTPGEAVRVRFGKWGGGRHWEFDLVYLGADDVGHWAGGPQALPMARPGLSVLAATDGVLCFSRTQGFVATRNAAHDDPGGTEIYVDITTVPEWSRGNDGVAEVRMVDLDLDVIRRFDGTTFVDDEDEFAEHQVTLGYPPEVVSAAERDCAGVLDAVTRGIGPYGDDGSRWLDGYRTGPYYRPIETR